MCVRAMGVADKGATLSTARSFKQYRTYLVEEEAEQQGDDAVAENSWGCRRTALSVCAVVEEEEGRKKAGDQREVDGWWE